MSHDEIIALIERLTNGPAHVRADFADHYVGLTTRHDILEAGLSDGLTNEELATCLDTEPRVRQHRTTLYCPGLGPLADDCVALDTWPEGWEPRWRWVEMVGTPNPVGGGWYRVEKEVMERRVNLLGEVS